MIVISDTTPIISLLKINRLDLLKTLFDEVLIPEAVFNELTTNSRYEKESEIVKNCDFLKVSKIEDEKSVALLQKLTNLDLGESEAIILAENLKSDLLLMDEVKGRAVANQMEIKITGTVGVILIAKERNLISLDEIKTAIDIFKKNHRHISNDLLKMLLM